MFSALKGATVASELLTEHQRAQMLALMQVCYAGVSAERFARDLADKQYVILLSARRSGELVGFSTLRVSEEQVEGRTVEVVFSGDTVIHPDYWGQKELQVRFGRFMLARKLRHPTRPLLWLLLSAGYKTYLLAVNHFPRTVPRHDWEAPTERVSFLRTLAGRWFGEQYDGTKGTVRFAGTHYRVRDGVAPIDREAAAHPHIAFFARNNPAHIEGEELVCLAEIRARDLMWALTELTMKQLRLWTRRGLKLIGVRA
ncbi:hypothetical protein [Archangium lansingense]|uniref:N-acetyltransferase domain-containing protein n=1 Tax=Archangium lansingense TaxID=2995310 RepID=A0ABT4APJ6_9BACT|nr:hypothetical protein [Archangium lansinium]MCY1082779.1 hypothetical protein [Archangium lansinium]